jgi:hypothetical protein
MWGRSIQNPWLKQTVIGSYCFLSSCFVLSLFLIILFSFFIFQLYSSCELYHILQNAQMVIMDLIVYNVVIHALLLCVNHLKEIAHMDVLKASKDISVLSQVF